MPVGTVSQSNTLIIPCATNELVTTSGVANKKPDDEMYHHVNPHQYIHECIQPVCNQYSTNDRINTMGKMGSLTSGNAQLPPKMAGCLQIL